MDLHRRWNRRLIYTSLIGSIFAVLAVWPLLRKPAALTATEARCVGSWSFTMPDRPTTLIVYRLAANRQATEEHYYLTSATPHLPRMTMVGQWRVEPDGQLIVEPNRGGSYAVDAARGFLGELFDNGRQRWAGPALTRFYWLDAATAQSLQVRASRSGAPGQNEFTMQRVGGGPAAFPLPRK